MFMCMLSGTWRAYWNNQDFWYNVCQSDECKLVLFRDQNRGCGRKKNKYRIQKRLEGKVLSFQDNGQLSIMKSMVYQTMSKEMTICDYLFSLDLCYCEYYCSSCRREIHSSFHHSAKSFRKKHTTVFRELRPTSLSLHNNYGNTYTLNVLFLSLFFFSGKCIFCTPIMQPDWVGNKINSLYVSILQEWNC